MTTGRRLPDTSIGNLPDDAQPGDYWKVLTREDEPRPLNFIEHPEDRRWFSGGDAAANLTGGVWGLITPLGQYALLSIHTVREEDDGTISVRPGDGSSNSILVTGPGTDGPESTYHGYIEHGVWTAC